MGASGTKSVYYQKTIGRHSLLGQIWEPIGGALGLATHAEHDASKTIDSFADLLAHPMYIAIGIGGVIVIFKMIQK